MSAEPLFTIITVTYNAQATLPATLQSVAEQTCADYEHLIIDGASTDTTLEIASTAPQSTTRVYSSPDRGIYDAMNKGMSLAAGRYLIFLNSGDTFHHSTTLGLIAKTIANHHEPGIVYGQTLIVDSERRPLGPRHLTAPPQLTMKSFADGMLVCHQAFIVLARIAMPYSLDYRYSADYEWCIRCLQHSRRNVFIDDYLIDYLNEGVTTANHRASLIERYRIMCRYYGTLPTMMRHVKFAWRHLRRSSITTQ
ncbi:MAG: glycosyltransferase [Bacteroidales bacterium]|nr:glycosyltransferase [Bacteroidales bacterium]